MPVELAGENLLPRPEIQAAASNGDDDLPAHDGALEMGVRVVLAPVVRILAVRLLRGRPLQPLFNVRMQANSSSLMNTEAEICIAFTRHI